MDKNNSSLRPRPPPLTLVRQNLEKIDAELSRCHKKVEELKLNETPGIPSMRAHHIT